MNKPAYLGMSILDIRKMLIYEFWYDCVCALRAKTYTYLIDDDSEKKKAKGIKTCVMKCRLMFDNYKDSLFNNKTIL